MTLHAYMNYKIFKLAKKNSYIKTKLKYGSLATQHLLITRHSQLQKNTTHAALTVQYLVGVVVDSLPCEVPHTVCDSLLVFVDGPSGDVYSVSDSLTVSRGRP